MQFIQLPAFNDNYIWLIEDSRKVWVVDPGDAEVVIDYLIANAMDLAGILITHHHKDHIGGIGALREWSLRSKSEEHSLVVYGPSNEEIALVTHPLTGGQKISILGHLQLEVIDVAGHTKGHIAYFAPNTLPPRVFCGDTLFASGCGRIFEGTPEQMFASLQRLANLPAPTLVCCAHEYTLSNLRFAQMVEPANHDLLAWIHQAQQLRQENKPTVPTSIGLEKKVNPFLRCDTVEVLHSATNYIGRQVHDSLDVFTVIRGWKDVFK